MFHNTLHSHFSSGEKLSGTVSPESVDMVSAAASRQRQNKLVFVDSAVANIDQLAAGLESSRVVILNDQQNGVDQITQAIAQHTGPALDSVHIISHGDRGSLQLGNTTLDTSTLSHYTDELTQWGAAIAPAGDLLLYGCNVAADAAGWQFVNQLSELTDADVAASEDLTGQGGDWDLEVKTGFIEAETVLDPPSQTAYQGMLASFNGKEYTLTRGRKTWEAAQAEAQAQGGNLVTINNAAEETFLKKTFGDTQGFWMGLSDRKQEGRFEWVNGEPLTYTNWAPGEPNDYRGNQDFGRLNFGSKRQWDDDSSSAMFQGIIERTPDAPTSPPASDTFNGSRYLLTTAKTWKEAQAEAQQLGGNLVTINNAAEERWIKDRFGESQRFWIGINDERQEGKFTWASGESVTYTNWAPGEPNDYQGNQDFGVMNFGGSRQWDDDRATAKFQGLVEIKNSPSQPPSGGPGIISVDNANLTVDEETGKAQITVVRQQGSDGTVSVKYRTLEGVALNGSDFQETSGTLTFAPGETEKTVSVALVNDNLAESNENFSLLLENVSGGATLGEQTTAKVTITDRDTPPGNVDPKDIFNGSRYLLTTAKTWKAAQAEAQQLGGNLVTINNAAEERWIKDRFGENQRFWIGINDERQEGKFTWASGETVTYTNWAPGEPNDYQGNQDFGVMNFGGSRQWDDDRATAKFQGLVEIKQSPDQPPSGGSGVISVEDATLTVDEETGNVQVNVTRQQGSQGTVSVGYRTLDGSAIALADYQSREGTLTFAPGVTQQSIPITLFNDNQAEGNEQFTLELFNPNGGAVLGSSNTVLINILDGDKSFARDVPDHYSGYNTNAITLSDWSNAATITTLGKAAAEIGGQTLRIPGGDTANYWDWQLGSIIKERTPGTDPYYFPEELPLSLNYQSGHKATLENIKPLFTSSQAEPIWVVNMLTSDLQTEIDNLLAANALGIPVHRIELGNELYFGLPNYTRDGGQSPGNPSAIGVPTASGYAAKAKDWAIAIRSALEAQPNINPDDVEIAVIGVTSQADSEQRIQDWWPALTEKTGPDNKSALDVVDAFTLHPYYSTKNINITKSDVGNSDRAGEIARDGLNQLRDRLANPTLQNPALANKQMWITEHTVIEDDVVVLGNSWLHALMMDLHTQEFLRDERTAISVAHVLTGNPQWQGLINQNGLQIDSDLRSDEDSDRPFTSNPADAFKPTAIGLVLGKTADIFTSGKATLLKSDEAFIAWQVENSANTISAVNANEFNETLQLPADGTWQVRTYTGNPWDTIKKESDLTITNQTLAGGSILTIPPFSKVIVTAG